MNIRNRVGTVLVVATVLAVPAARTAESSPPPEMQAEFVDLDAAEARSYRDAGDRAITRLGFALVQDSAADVNRYGPIGALPRCHLRDLPMKNGTVAGMPRITAMKLTSLKVRNPANAPDPAEQLALARVETDLEAGTPPNLLVQRITWPDGRREWRVYKPLAVLRQCLVCHGDPAAQPADLQAALKQLYPADQARDYAAGQWRGLLRVTVADPVPPPLPPARVVPPSKGLRASN